MTRGAGMAVLAATIVIVAGYVLQLGLGRSVPPAEFAFLQETLAFYMMAMLPLQPIGAVITKQSARRDDRLWNNLTHRSVLVFSLLTTIALFVSTGRGSARQWDPSILLTFALAVVTGIAFVIANSLAIGHLDFVGSTIAQTIQAMVRLGIALPLVWWGTGARGLWCATAIANLGAALCAKWRLASTRSIGEPHEPIPARMKLDFAIGGRGGGGFRRYFLARPGCARRDVRSNPIGHWVAGHLLAPLWCNSRSITLALVWFQSVGMTWIIS